MKTRILAVVAIAVFFSSATVLAQEPLQGNEKRMDERPMMRNHEPRGGFGRDLALTEEQKEAIKEIRMEAEKGVKPLRNKLQEMEARQHTLTTADKADMKAIYKNIEEMADVRIEIEKIRAEKHQEVRSLLTEEQLIKFDRFREKRFGEMGGRPGPEMGKKMARNMEGSERPPFEENER